MMRKPKAHLPSSAKPVGRNDLYVQAFQMASIPTLICDPQGAILEVNQALTLLLGYHSEELRNKRVSEITHEGDLQSHHGRLTQLISGKDDKVSAEKRYVRKDGNTVWGAIAVAVVKDAEGQPTFLISQIRDITTERRTREKLLESEGRLEAILDNSEAIIYGKDLLGRYVLVNRQFERLFGLARERVLGFSDHELFPAEIADAFCANDQKVALMDRGMQFEEEAVVPDGGTHTYVSVKFPLRNLRGQTVAICCISTDITSRKSDERALKELNDCLRMANEELKEAQLHLIQQRNWRAMDAWPSAWHMR